VPEDRITEADIERMMIGFARYNDQDWDGLRELVSPDVVIERAGGQPPLLGWDAMRQMLEPDAFAWQRMHPLGWEINADKALLHVRIHAQGAGSGVELDVEGWQVWTVRDGVMVRMQNFLADEEAEARAAAGLGQNASP
jgi:ketosteroid isomerase-like protein